jgi:recombinational DNA repair protein RecR
MRQLSRSIIANLEQQTPGARHGLLHSLEEIRRLYRNGTTVPPKIKNCSLCNEVTSREICQACTMKQWLSEV